MHAAAAVLALALAAELPPSVVPGTSEPAPAPAVEAPPPAPAPAAPAAPPRPAEPAPPEPARALSPEVLESLGDAAVAYSWSGPLKWAAVGSATAGAALLAADDEDASDKAGRILIGAAVLQAGIALAIDWSARQSLAEAGRIRAPRPPGPEEDDDDEDGVKPAARTVPKPGDDHRDDYDL